MAEEARELRRGATDVRAPSEELGDLLLVIVNLARKLGIDAEAALRSASAKFARRFAHVERIAAEDATCSSADLTLDELDELWEERKALEIVSRRGR